MTIIPRYLPLLSIILTLVLPGKWSISAQEDTLKDPLQVVEIPADITVERGVEYARVGENSATVLLYDLLRRAETESGKASAAPASPLLLFIHGGGWKGGTRSSYYRRLFFDATESLIDQGLVVATIDYRLAVKGGATTLDSVDDCRTALKYFQENAAKLNIDSRRIVVMGGSAGGHLTLMTALAAARDGGAYPQVKACVPYYPLCHFGGVELYPELMAGVSYGAPGKFTDMLGGAAESQRALADYLSPINHLRVGMPNVLLLHGDADPVLPVASARAFAAKAKAMGAPLTYVEVAGGNHGFRTADDPTVAEIIGRVRRFLAEQTGLQAE